VKTALAASSAKSGNSPGRGIDPNKFHIFP